MTLWFHGSVFFVRWTDENVHLYVARRMAEGLVLYRDIHSARPPLALLPLVAGWWAGVPPLWTARGSLVLALFATAAVLWWAGHRLFGPWTGAVAAALFLVTPEVSARNAWTGIHPVALGGLWCVTLAWRGHGLWAGVTAGLALASGQHAAVLVAGAALVVVARHRRALWRFVAGAAIALVPTFGVAAARSGPARLWEDLAGRHLYHLGAAAPGAEGDLSFFQITTLLENLPWLALALWAVLRPREDGSAEAREARLARWSLGALALAHVLVVRGMSGGLILYAFPAVPLVALLAGDGVVSAGRWVFRGADVPRRGRRGLLLAAVLASPFFLGWPAARQRYQARDGEQYALIPMVRQAQMARLQRLTAVDQVLELVRPMLRDGDTVFGYPTLASVVALGSGRRISGELVDLAPRWISLGLVSRKSIIESVEADGVRVFVAQAGAFELDSGFRQYLTRCYRPPQVIPRATGEGRGIPRINVFEHIDGPCLASR
jgi:hypothetical protein